MSLFGFDAPANPEGPRILTLKEWDPWDDEIDGDDDYSESDIAAAETGLSASQIVAARGKRISSGVKRFDARAVYPTTYRLLVGKSEPGLGNPAKPCLFPGGMAFRADYTQAVGSWDRDAPPVVRPVDFLGLADIVCWTPQGQTVLVQVTTKGAIRAHFRDYTNTTKEVKTGLKNPHATLRACLARNIRFLVFGFEKVGSRWVETIVEATPELLDGYLARKRGAKKK